ncbi:uncharacterized protein LOC114356437 isoform X1 [Ostrinia furnacalis]|uniref:uncharacterized protein LOC114356437 isoform X1 n=1 Tax=Ostrinia furnacalis TaxID=93504 RepID=UPI00103F24FB|nr:uncharacterized protein LOC114356437 isoform X1 [Ostrinia furnacalis]
MMKCLCVLFFVAVAQGFVTRVARGVEGVPAPTLLRITLVDDPKMGFVVDWTPVASNDAADPILGYKMKVWEQPKIKTYKYETINGVKTLVEEYAPGKFPANNEVPTNKPREIVIQGDKTSARFEGIETGVLYEVRVQAFTKNIQGPLSQPMRVEINNDNDRKKDVYTVA